MSLMCAFVVGTVGRMDIWTATPVESWLLPQRTWENENVRSKELKRE